MRDALGPKHAQDRAQLQIEQAFFHALQNSLHKYMRTHGDKSKQRNSLVVRHVRSKLEIRRTRTDCGKAPSDETVAFWQDRAKLKKSKFDVSALSAEWQTLLNQERDRSTSSDGEAQSSPETSAAMSKDRKNIHRHEGEASDDLAEVVQDLVETSTRVTRPQDGRT